MEKKRKKMPVKSRLRALYRVCALVCAVTVALAVPMEAGAEGPSEDDYVIEVEYKNPFQIAIWDNAWVLKRVVDDAIYGVDYSVDFEGAGFIIRSRIYIQDLIEPYKPLISTATKVWITFIDGTGIWNNRGNGNGHMNFMLNVDGEQLTLSSMSFNGFKGDVNQWQPHDLATILKGADLDGFQVFTDYYCTYDSSQYMGVLANVSQFAVVLWLQGIDGTDAEQFVVINNGLSDIESAVNDVRDEVRVMQSQLGGIQNDINSGFGQIGDQISGVQGNINSGFSNVNQNLGGIQNDLNTGFGNVSDAINGAGADTSGMDSGLSELGGQLGDLGDIEDQIGGAILDKVEVPDLILTDDQGSALALLVSCLNLAYVDLSGLQVMFAAVLFFGIIGVLLFGRRNL